MHPASPAKMPARNGNSKAEIVCFHVCSNNKNILKLCKKVYLSNGF